MNLKVKEYEHLLAQSPGSLTLRLKLAAALRHTGRHGDAMALYREVARAYQAEGRLVQALAVCRSILEIEPGDGDTQALYAEIDAARTGAPLEDPTRLDDGTAASEVTSVRGDFGPMDTQPSPKRPR